MKEESFDEFVNRLQEEIIEKEREQYNDYIVEFKSGSADIVDTVDITSLWKFTR